ncbi:hypothetical protein AFLA_004373 [Aspergillus flavus NRRL3357]|nr:hypothetical protein AFLA_004373 [Aspergillus flavus NRRL3357]
MKLNPSEICHHQNDRLSSEYPQTRSIAITGSRQITGYPSLAQCWALIATGVIRVYGYGKGLCSFQVHQSTALRLTKTTLRWEVRLYIYVKHH